jgi:hypothetical protein
MHGDFGFSCEGDTDSNSERERSDNPPHPCSLSTPLPFDILMPYLQSLSWVNPKSRPHRPLPPFFPSTPLPVKSLKAKLSIPAAKLRHNHHYHHSAFALLAISPFAHPLPRQLFFLRLSKKLGNSHVAWPCNNNLKTAFWLLTSNCIPGRRILSGLAHAPQLPAHLVAASTPSGNVGLPCLSARPWNLPSHSMLYLASTYGS